MNPLFLIDFYKVDHISQYPKGITKIWSNWTPRYTHVSGQKYAIHFGLQYFIKKYLLEEFDSNFFYVDISRILREYRNVIKNTLGIEDPRVDHIVQLWNHGSLPIEIYSLPEGSKVPLGVPAMVITNTEPWAFWLVNFIETLLSNILWRPSTSATTAHRFRQLILSHAVEAKEKDLSFVDWMGHDFSFRGMSGVEDAMLSGVGHLLSFNGTDTIPAILGANKYYGADLNCGGSVPATEHSVMCAGSKDGEFETFKRLITETYPSGIVSIVSDTWDLWKVLRDYIPQLRDEILRRDGKIVIRPDSGDPVKIICGDVDAIQYGPHKGALELLALALGEKEGRINNGGLIYGDGISYQRCDEILKGIRKKNFSIYNIVFGIGSYTYAYVTRDTYGFAMKATAVERDGIVEAIYKDPITDDGGKRSLKGIPLVWESELPGGPEYTVTTTNDPKLLNSCAFVKVFRNSELLVEESFNEIRKRVRK